MTKSRQTASVVTWEQSVKTYLPFRVCVIDNIIKKSNCNVLTESPGWQDLNNSILARVGWGCGGEHKGEGVETTFEFGNMLKASCPHLFRAVEESL